MARHWPLSSRIFLSARTSSRYRSCWSLLRVPGSSAVARNEFSRECAWSKDRFLYPSMAPNDHYGGLVRVPWAGRLSKQLETWKLPRFQKSWYSPRYGITEVARGGDIHASRD